METKLKQEIQEQPTVQQRLLDEQTETAKTIANAIRAFDPAFVSIAARGTSDNAGRYAQYLFGSHLGLPVALSTPSLHTLYETPPNLSRALVIGISQSGRAEDVRRVLSDANNDGAITVAITNNPDSPMAQTAQHHLYISAEREESIAATKTYTAQLTSIALLCAAIADDESLFATLAKLPTWMTETLEQSWAVLDWAERYRYMERFAVIGRGYNYATSFEISLKIKELTYITGEGYSEADFLHGPIATVGYGFPVILVAPQGKTLSRMRELVDTLREKQAELLVISNDDEMLTHGMHNMGMSLCPEWISPVLSVVPGQIFAMQQAQYRGYEVDKPRGLSKVTVTE